MKVDEALKTRRSVHNFDPEKEIGEETLREIFELVRITPSGYNLQPVEFLVVKDKQLQEKLKAVSYNQQHVYDASAVAIVLSRKDPENWCEKTFADWVEKGYFNEEIAKTVIGSVKSWPNYWGKDGMKAWAHKHAGLYAMALMVAAMQYGVQTEPMEGFDGQKVRELFGIPEHFEIPMFVCLGYQNKEQLPRLNRKKFEELVHVNKL